MPLTVKLALTAGTHQLRIPDGVTQLSGIYGIGGGGGGAGAENTGPSSSSGGGGGGGGACAIKNPMVVSAGEIYLITVGAGGVGGSDLGEDGANGGDTRLDTFPSGEPLLLAKPGEGGFSSGGIGGNSGDAVDCVGDESHSGGDGGDGGTNGFTRGGGGGGAGGGTEGEDGFGFGTGGDGGPGVFRFRAGDGGRGATDTGIEANEPAVQFPEFHGAHGGGGGGGMSVFFFDGTPSSLPGGNGRPGCFQAIYDRPSRPRPAVPAGVQNPIAGALSIGGGI